MCKYYQKTENLNGKIISKLTGASNSQQHSANQRQDKIETIFASSSSVFQIPHKHGTSIQQPALN